MRHTLLAALLAAPLTSAVLIPSSFYDTLGLSRFLPGSPPASQAPLALQEEHQSPILSPVLPPGADDSMPAASDDSAADLTISDILPLSRAINIFAQLTRDIASVTTRLSTNTAAANTTLLAPLNSAMQGLPRKPWEDRPGSGGVSAQHDEQKAAENLRRFVEMHIVPISPWQEGPAGKTEPLGGGGPIWWEHGRGDHANTRFVKGPGFELEVSEVVGRVGNGEIWAVKGVVNYE